MINFKIIFYKLKKFLIIYDLMTPEKHLHYQSILTKLFLMTKKYIWLNIIILNRKKY